MSSNLSEEHELQVHSYLRFAKDMRVRHVAATQEAIKEFQKENLIAGEMYNYEDMCGLLVKMSEDMSKLVDGEIQHAYITSGLIVKACEGEGSLPN
eukprot:gene20271-27027_t